MDIEPECCVAYIKDLNTIKDRMTDKQELYFSNEKSEEEIKHLRTLHVNGSEVSSMDI